jgi:hypothetical protein
MFRLTITERKLKKHRGLCSNLRCQAPLEPPYNLYSFQIEDRPKVFQRAFCVKCHAKLQAMSPRQVYFEVLVR